MRIDNRVFIPFAGPFVLLLLFRSAFFLAGAEWSNPNSGAVVSLFLGVPAGAIIMSVMYVIRVSIGHITIGKGRTND